MYDVAQERIKRNAAMSEAEKNFWVIDLKSLLYEVL